MRSGYSIPLVLIIISFMFAFSLFLQKLVISALKMSNMESLNQRMFTALESGETYIIYKWNSEPPENVNLNVNDINLTMKLQAVSNEQKEALYRYKIENEISMIKGFLKVKKNDFRRLSEKSRETFQNFQGKGR